jgi:hypothetical protein
MVPMSFLAIKNLIWGLPVVAIIVALYLLRMRRQEMRIPKSFLWPNHTEEIRANSLFQRIKFSWLMVLQIIAALLLTAAFAKPQIEQRSVLGQYTVIVLDGSASMLATDIKASRFEAAKKLAIDAVSSAQANDHVAMVLAGTTPKVVFGLSRDPGTQLSTIRELKAAETEGQMDEALRLAAALVSSVPSARILVLSDGCFAPIENFSPGKAGVVYQKIGSRQENAAITALGASSTPRGNEVYVGLKNYGLNQTKLEVDVFADGKIVTTRNVTLESLKPGGFTCSVPSDAKVIKAVIQTDDLLEGDNIAYAKANSSSSIRTLLISKGNPFLERALLLDPRVVLERADKLPVSSSDFDLVIFDSVKAEPCEAKVWVSFSGASQNSGQVVQQEEKDILQDVDLQSVYFEKTQSVSGIPVAKTSAGTLIGIERGAQTVVRCGFDLLNSDFPLQVSFPIFVGNLIDLVGKESENQDRFLRTGSQLTFRSSQEVQLTFPNGSRKTIQPKNNLIQAGLLEHSGEYQIQSGEETKRVFVNLQSNLESNIAPVSDLVLGNENVKAVVTPIQMRELWRVFATIAVVVLCFEWWLFTRKN